MAVSIFDLSLQGSPSVGSELWVDLATIPSGKQIWMGYATYTSPDKVVTFELRGNIVGESAGTIATTSLYASSSVKAGLSVNADLYRKGRLILRTVAGTGVEHWWLRIKSKSASAAAILYSLYYTLY